MEGHPSTNDKSSQAEILSSTTIRHVTLTVNFPRPQFS